MKNRLSAIRFPKGCKIRCGLIHESFDGIDLHILLRLPQNNDVWFDKVVLPKNGRQFRLLLTSL